MRRQQFQALMAWKDSPDRKPLLLQGARQVGKTYLIRQFAEVAYPDFVYCNFEEDPALAQLFDGKLSAAQLIEQLSFYTNKKINAETTLIIFDEIQLAPRAITSLKYFEEQAREYPVIAAGSLLGVSIGQESAFPVGKVDFLDLYPLNFIEYLQAVGEEKLAELLLAKKDFSALIEPIHEKIMGHFRLFLFMGGMPEVVQSYCSYQDITKVQSIQRNIHKAYANDFSKYASPAASLKISNIWQSIPAQLAKENKKFKFNDVEQNARYSRYELAIEWLRKAGLIYLSYNTSTPKPPLSAYMESSSFKLYYLDTGLLGSRLQALPQIMVLQDSLYTEFKGALIENYCAKELRPLCEDYLYYWTSKSAAEVDFVIEVAGHIFPIEVKSGYSKHKKSLQSFQEKYNSKYILRISPRNFTKENGFINIPLYATGILKNLLITAADHSQC